MGKFLVTGGAGFIGSHLTEALVSDGNSVRVLDDLSTGRKENLPRGVELVTADVSDPVAVRCALDGVDGCFHLAAIASVERGRLEWLRSHTVNLTGTITVFEAACLVQKTDGRKLPVVYASSAAVYGDADELPTAETVAAHPTNAYGVDKLGSELHAAVASHTHNLAAVGLRLFNVYGPRQNPDSPYSGVISIFCRRILQQAPIEIHGDGSQVRDFVYVDDAVAALRRAMAAATPLVPQVFNVCTGIGTPIVKLAELIAQISDVKLRRRSAPARLGDLHRSIGDPRLTREKLGFRARTSLQAGLARTLTAMTPLANRAITDDPMVATSGN